MSATEKTYASQLCYVKQGIDGGSLVVRTAPNSSSETVTLLYEGTPVVCKREGGWLTIQGTNENGQQQNYYFQDSEDFFEPTSYKTKPRISGGLRRPVSVFDKIGQTYKTCDESQNCHAVSWPDQTASVEILDTQVGWNQESNRNEVFYKIETRYKRKAADGKVDRHGIGWVRARDIEFLDLSQEITGPLPPPPKWSDEIPPLSESHHVGQKPDCAVSETATGSLRAISKFVSARVEEPIDDAFTALKPLVGKCLLDAHPRNETKVVKKRNKKTGKLENVTVTVPRTNMTLPNVSGNYALPFDKYMMAGHWDKQKSTTRIPNIPHEGRGRVSIDEVIAIDTLARTIYAEMATCSDKSDWDRYFQAVAKVSVNRMEALSSSDASIKRMALRDFVGHGADDKFRSLKHDMTRVLIEPYSYSVWNPVKPGGTASNLKQVLCPPAHRGQRMYNGEVVDNDPIDKEELASWEHALRYAVEAVLFPSAFEGRTRGMQSMFYSSNTNMKNMTLTKPTMAGFSSFDRYCMQFWEPKSWN